jgi:hypothetical protein
VDPEAEELRVVFGKDFLDGVFAMHLQDQVEGELVE